MNKKIVIALVIALLVVAGTYLYKTDKLNQSTTSNETGKIVVQETPPAKTEDDIQNELNRMDKILGETSESDFDENTLSDLTE